MIQRVDLCERRGPREREGGVGKAPSWAQESPAPFLLGLYPPLWGVSGGGAVPAVLRRNFLVWLYNSNSIPKFPTVPGKEWKYFTGSFSKQR